MKTKVNYQKTILKSIVLVISFVLVGISLHAQDLLNLELNGSSLMALAENDDNPKTSLVSAYFYYAPVISIEESVEAPVDMEEWMTNDSYFIDATMALENETDEGLEIGEWMLETENFEIEEGNTEIEEMQKFITGRNFILVIDSDEELEVEDWMINSKVWDDKQ